MYKWLLIKSLTNGNAVETYIHTVINSVDYMEEFASIDWLETAQVGEYYQRVFSAEYNVVVVRIA